MADNASNAECLVVDKLVGQFLILGKVRTYDASDIVDPAADLPAFDHGIDRTDALFETAVIGLLLQDDLGEYIDRPRQQAKLDHGLISRDNPRLFEPAHAFQTRARRQSNPRRQFLNRRAAIRLERGENFYINCIESRRSFCDH